MEWKLLGLIPILRVEGTDVSLSSVGRFGAEAVWMPTALLPRFGVVWSADDESHLTARFSVDGVELALHLLIDDAVSVRSIHLDRWGDPENAGSFGWYPFGVEYTSHRTFDGLTIPNRGRDVEIIEILPTLTGAGVGEGDLLRMARVWGDSARRVAQFLSYYLHNTIEEPSRLRGLRDKEAFEAAIREVGVRAGRSGEDLLGWLFRRHSDVFTLEHQFEHVETALEEAGVRPRAPRSMEAAVFADLTGYTRFTEEAGDEAAADVSLRLAHLVSEARFATVARW